MCVFTGRRIEVLSLKAVTRPPYNNIPNYNKFKCLGDKCWKNVSPAPQSFLGSRGGMNFKQITN